MLAVYVLAVLLSAVEDDRSTPAVDVGTRKQLLVDDHVVNEMVRVRRELSPVVKANEGKPVLVADQPWEQRERIGFYMNAIQAGSKLQMWYLATSSTVGYAESADGMAWTKPMVSADGKSNIVFQGHGFTAMIDDHETDPARRYKAAYGHLKQIRACLAYSPDGIRWTPYNRGQPVTHRASDTHNQLLWDSIRCRYLLFTRTDFGTGGGPGEIRGTRTMANGDVNADPTAWVTLRNWKLDREGAAEAQRHQIYAITGWIHEGIYFAMMKVIEVPDVPGRSAYRDSPDYQTRHEQDVMDCYLATSRDAVEWDCRWVYARKPFIPRGPAASWDKDGILPSATLVTRGDRHWIYYTGMNERHGCRKRQTAIGLATLPLDRFVALAADDPPGTVTTKPFRLEAARLEINADARGGSLAVEVLEPSGSPIPGFRQGESRPLSDVDGHRLAASWLAHPDLAPLKGRVVCLRLTIHRARLYAFRLCD